MSENNNQKRVRKRELRKRQIPYIENTEESSKYKHYFPLETKQFVNALVLPAADKLFSYRQNETLFLTKIKDAFPLYPEPEAFLEISKDKFIEGIIYELKSAADNILGKGWVVTPWTIELAKEKASLVDFLGPVRTKLPIAVVNNNAQTYYHEITEELFFGLVVVLRSSENISVYIFTGTNPSELENLADYDISEPFIKNYKIGALFGPTILRKYVATLETATQTTDKFTFNTTDVIQGIITACMWLNRDPHKFILEIREGDTLLTF